MPSFIHSFIHSLCTFTCNRDHYDRKGTALIKIIKITNILLLIIQMTILVINTNKY